MDYKDKLKDERWISFSNSMKAMFGYRCCGCGNSENLQTHHKRYRKGLEPWEYCPSDMTVLCSKCHSTFHKNKEEITKALMDSRLFFTYEASMIVSTIKALCKMDTANIMFVKEYAEEVVENERTF